MRLSKVSLVLSVVLMVMLCSMSTFAQTEKMTLQQAVEMALRADYQIKTDLNSLEKAKLAVKKAALDIFPQATIEEQYQYQTNSDTYPNGFQIVVKETIPTPYNLYGRKIVSNIEAAMWEQVVCEAALQIDQAEVIYNTYEDYLNILKIQQLIKQHEAAVATYQASNELAKKQLSLGKITKPDQLKVENYLNQAQYDLEKDRSDLEIAQAKLANQIGLDDLSGYQVEEINDDTGLAEVKLSELQKQALQKRLEIQKNEIEIKKAQRIWAQTKNKELPSISVSYNDQSDQQSFGLSYDLLSGDFSWLAVRKDDSYRSDITSRSGDNSNDFFGNDQQYFTVKFSWSWGFGEAQNSTKQAQYDVENTKLALEKTKTDVALSVKQAFNDYNVAVKAYDLNQKALVYYDKDVEIKELRLQLGLITCGDLAEARQDALEARISAIKSGYDRLLAGVKLKKVTGELYPFDHPPVLGGKHA